MSVSTALCWGCFGDYSLSKGDLMKPIKCCLFAVGISFLLLGCPPPPIGCLDFQEMTNYPMELAGPTFSFGLLDFTNPTRRDGSPEVLSIEDRVEDHDGKAELNIPYSYESDGYKPLIVDFSKHYKHGVSRISVELRHFYGAEIFALDSADQIIASATCNGENVRRELILEATGIMKVKFHAVETLVYKICWTR
jgi:hypothetical protein